ncbi:TPA: protein rep [Staphylococcus aureus]|nr:protein rep [Staphylococcus aureus]
MISLINNSNDFITLEETSKYSVKSSDFLTDDDEKNQEIVSDLEKGLYRKSMLSYGGLLKQKHKILNLDDAEDGNLINTSDEDKTTDEEKKHIQLRQFGISKSKIII